MGLCFGQRVKEEGSDKNQPWRERKKDLYSRIDTHLSTGNGSDLFLRQSLTLKDLNGLMYVYLKRNKYRGSNLIIDTLTS